MVDGVGVSPDLDLKPLDPNGVLRPSHPGWRQSDLSRPDPLPLCKGYWGFLLTSVLFSE